MKKFHLAFALVVSLFFTCNDNDNPAPENQSEIDMSDFYVYTSDISETSKSGESKETGRSCYTMENLNRLLKENPGLEKRMYDIEYQTRKFIASKSNERGKPGIGGGGGTVDNSDVDVAPIADGLGTIVIPVNFIIVNADANSITDQQVQDQLNVLNADFRNLNEDDLPDGTTFANDRTDTEIQFTIAGIERHNDRTKFWGTNDAVKLAYPPSNPEHQLNIWVCDISRSILGYAQFPGGPAATDGVVIGTNYFGFTGGAYGYGRTATHEIGHYLNLRHIWGDGGCSQDDFVLDTPTSDRSNGGCPAFPTVHCNTPDMTMNYMDYTYDKCMYMFTDGQRNRMRAIFTAGGARSNFLITP